jgi:nicotinamidase/pyrazinamidase
MREGPADALLVVDVQNDFCAGGALAVPDGDAVIPVINRVARAMALRGAPVFASRDWHPRDSRHFVTGGGAWPVHCVAGTPGAQFHPGLNLPDDAHLVTKGDAPAADGYSAFDGRLETGDSLETALRARGVRRLIVAGLATDYCVKHSALDARRKGFAVVVLADAVRGVEVAAGDTARALDELASAGVTFASSSELAGDARRGPPPRSGRLAEVADVDEE